jgi:SAM-dependent methyltransferase
MLSPNHSPNRLRSTASWFRRRLRQGRDSETQRKLTAMLERLEHRMRAVAEHVEGQIHGFGETVARQTGDLGGRLERLEAAHWKLGDEMRQISADQQKWLGGQLLQQTAHLRDEVAALRDELAGLLASATAGLEQRFDALPAHRDALLDRIGRAHGDLQRHIHQAAQLRELYHRDLVQMFDRVARVLPSADVELTTEYPIAVDSDDHKFPWGTMNDNTRSPRFVRACEAMFPAPIQFMDLGCSGGGLVLDFLLRGHRAIGVEGSDYSRRAQRAEWRLLPGHLFTADITRPFTARQREGGETTRCHLISAWEVLEHIAERDLPPVFQNIARHLRPEGIFVGSVTTVPDGDPTRGAVYHQTVEQRPWWEAKFRELGFETVAEHPFTFRDYCRLTGNGPLDSDLSVNPDTGFHFVLRQTAA